MSTDCEASRDDRSAWAKRKAVVIALGVLATAMLLANACTMSICEDEANGFYLSKKPLGEMFDLMLANFHEDPPLADVILHCWIGVAGHRLWLLRSLPVLCWLLMIPGLFLVTRRLAGRRGAWFAMAALFLMPYHWTIPAAFRWYSLYALLAVWNFFFFLRIREAACPPGEESPAGMKSRVLLTLPYALTGACLWYTNYSAPVFFFVHLVVGLCSATRRRQIVIDLVLGWVLIVLLFAPWIATFLRQLDTSVRPMSFSYAGLSLYALFAGEFSIPMNFWISVPVAVECVLLLVLIPAHFRQGWIPLLVCVVVLGALLQTGAIGPKRLLIVSPFLAVTLGIALSETTDRSRWMAMARYGLVTSVLLVAAGSAVNMLRRDGWSAYRWLDPTEAVVKQIQSRSPESLVISDSNPVFFYLQDEYGKNLCRMPQQYDPAYDPQAILYRLDANYRPVRDRMLAAADRAVWVYHSPYDGPISNHYREMVDQMQQHGFQVCRTEPFLKASRGFLDFHPKFRNRSPDPLNDYRIVMVHFTKSELCARPAAQTPRTR